MSDQSTKVTAYSYIRFSSAAQADGDSLRRQTERAEEYARRRGWRLDTALTLRDLGVSAFRGDNALTGNLGTFLTAVERGTVRAGSVLIVESFDRISRQGIDEGYEIVKRILKADVRIVTLSPEREFDREATRSLSKGALEIMLILERAAEESERKSDRVSRAWANKQKRARDGVVMTDAVPAWVRRDGDRLALIPEAAAAVRRVFELATAGYGGKTIVQLLTREGVPPIGKAGHWARSYVAKILRDETAAGVYQPRRGAVADGPPVRDYYPPVVTEGEWLRARAAVRARERHRGRTAAGEVVNVFAGVLFNAGGREAFQMTHRQNRDGAGWKRYPVLMNADGVDGRGPVQSLPYLPFETEFLRWFREIDASQLLPGNGDESATARKAADLERVESELAAAADYMERNGFSPTIGDRVAALEARKRDLAADLAELRQRAAHPVGEAWGQAATLAEVLATADDKRDTRIRLRALLRSVVERIDLLISPRRAARLALVQVTFAGGGFRHYLIEYRPACNGRGEVFAADSFKADGGPVDLRRARDVAKMRKTLDAIHDARAAR